MSLQSSCTVFKKKHKKSHFLAEVEEIRYLMNHVKAAQPLFAGRCLSWTHLFPSTLRSLFPDRRRDSGAEDKVRFALFFWTWWTEMLWSVRNKQGSVTLYAEFKASVSSFRFRLSVSQTCDTCSNIQLLQLLLAQSIYWPETPKVCSDTVKLRFLIIRYDILLWTYVIAMCPLIDRCLHQSFTGTHPLLEKHKGTGSIKALNGTEVEYKSNINIG